MLYGATGSLELARGSPRRSIIRAATRPAPMFGLVFIVAGLAFKLASSPSNMWVRTFIRVRPSVTPPIASAPKLAAFGMAMRSLVNGLFELADQWQSMLMFLAVLSIALNIAAIVSRTGKADAGRQPGTSDTWLHACSRRRPAWWQRQLSFRANAYSSAMFYVFSYAPDDPCRVRCAAGSLPRRVRLRESRRSQGPTSVVLVVRRGRRAS